MEKKNTEAIYFILPDQKIWSIIQKCIVVYFPCIMKWNSVITGQYVIQGMGEKILLNILL